MQIDLTHDEIQYIENCIELEYELWDAESFPTQDEEKEQHQFFRELLNKLFPPQ